MSCSMRVEINKSGYISDVHACNRIFRFPEKPEIWG